MYNMLVTVSFNTWNYENGIAISPVCPTIYNKNLYELCHFFKFSLVTQILCDAEEVRLLGDFIFFIESINQEGTTEVYFNQ